CADKNHRDYSKEELENFIQKNNTFFDKCQKNPRLKNHSLFGAWMSLFFWGKDIDYSLDTFLFLAILKAHHGHLKKISLASMNPVENIENLMEISEVIDFGEYSGMMNDLGLPFQSGNMAE